MSNAWESGGENPRQTSSWDDSGSLDPWGSGGTRDSWESSEIPWSTDGETYSHESGYSSLPTPLLQGATQGLSSGRKIATAKSSMSGLARTTLLVTVVGIVAVGFSGYNMLASIHFTLSDPLGEAGGWFGGFGLGAVLLFVATVLGVILVIRKGERALGAIALGLTLLIGPIIASWTVAEGTAALLGNARVAAGDAAGSVTGVLENHGVGMPTWLEIVLDIVS